MPFKDISLNKKQIVLDAIKESSALISSTMGAKGRYVLIEDNIGQPLITNDGNTVATSISYRNRYKDMGAKVVINGSSKTNALSGDATSLTANLIGHLCNIGYNEIKSGVNPVDVTDKIKKDSLHFLDYLKDIKVDASEVTNKHLEMIASVSCKDKEFGKVIAKAYDLVGGKDGNVYIGRNSNAEHKITSHDGATFDAHIVSEYLYDDYFRKESDINNPIVLMIQDEIRNPAQMAHVFSTQLVEFYMSSGRPLLLVFGSPIIPKIAEAIVRNKSKGMDIQAVRLTGNYQDNFNSMKDLQVLVGGTIFATETGRAINTISLNDFGTASNIRLRPSKMSVSFTKTTEIMNYADSLEKELEVKYSDLTEYEETKLRERIGRLKGGIVLIRVGGTTSIEVENNYKKFEDGVLACRSALEEGYVVGGGIVFQDYLLSTSYEDGEHSVFNEAIAQPSNQILINAGIEYDFNFEREYQCGVDVKTNEQCNLIDRGIIDPAKSVRVAVENAVSSACQFLLTEGIIVGEYPDK